MILKSQVIEIANNNQSKARAKHPNAPPRHILNDWPSRSTLLSFTQIPPRRGGNNEIDFLSAFGCGYCRGDWFFAAARGRAGDANFFSKPQFDFTGSGSDP